MKIFKTLLIFISLHFSVFSQTQIPNGNFETWIDQYNATGWNSINTGIHSAKRTTDFNSGNYAAELITNSIIIANVPGIITLGEIDEENLTVTGGIPFADRPTGLSYYFKYSPVGNDTAYMVALLTKWNTIDLKTDTIGITGYFTNYDISLYTKVAVPFVYISEELPDTLNVVFLSSGLESHAGSNLKIDDVLCEYGTVISPTLCFPAVNVSSTHFTANWLPVPDATSYSIDVSTQIDFSSYLSGFEDYDTGTDTFCIVNVSPDTYYYRARVHYDSETSINSNTIEVIVEASDITIPMEDYAKITTVGNQIMIEYETTEPGIITLYNTEGKQIINTKSSSEIHTVSVKTPGIYFLELNVKNQIIGKKILVVF